MALWDLSRTQAGSVLTMLTDLRETTSGHLNRRRKST